MRTDLFIITAFYVLTPVLTAPRGRQNVMALRGERRRFMSCCFVDIFCFTVCFHSGDRTRNEFAAGERLRNIRHLNHKRRQFSTQERTSNSKVTAGQLRNAENLNNLQNPSPFDINEQYDAITNQRHRPTHRHRLARRSKRSANLLWNKLRFVSFKM